MNREMKRCRGGQQQHLQLERAIGADFSRPSREQQRAGRHADRKPRPGSHCSPAGPRRRWVRARNSAPSARKFTKSAPLVTSMKPRTWIALNDAVRPAEPPTAPADSCFRSAQQVAHENSHLGRDPSAPRGWSTVMTHASRRRQNPRPASAYSSSALDTFGQPRASPSPAYA